MADADVLQVTNHNPFPLPGRYAGEDYSFPTERPVEISRRAATHIFGLGQDDKRRALAQLGLFKDGTSYRDALALLRKVSFEEGQMVYHAQQQPPGQTPPQHQPNEPGHPGQPGHQPGQQPGQKPGQQPDHPGKEKKGPGQHEQDDESEESGDRPGAPKGPGRKSEAEGYGIGTNPLASGDLEPVKRQW